MSHNSGGWIAASDYLASPAASIAWRITLRLCAQPRPSGISETPSASCRCSPREHQLCIHRVLIGALTPRVAKRRDILMAASLGWRLIPGKPGTAGAMRTVVMQRFTPRSRCGCLRSRGLRRRWRPARPPPRRRRRSVSGSELTPAAVCVIDASNADRLHKVAEFLRGAANGWRGRRGGCACCRSRGQEYTSCRPPRRVFETGAHLPRHGRFGLRTRRRIGACRRAGELVDLRTQSVYARSGSARAIGPFFANNERVMVVQRPDTATLWMSRAGSRSSHSVASILLVPARSHIRYGHRAA